MADSLAVVDYFNAEADVKGLLCWIVPVFNSQLARADCSSPVDALRLVQNEPILICQLLLVLVSLAHLLDFDPYLDIPALVRKFESI